MASKMSQMSSTMRNKSSTPYADLVSQKRVQDALQKSAKREQSLTKEQEKQKTPKKKKVTDQPTSLSIEGYP